MESQNNGIRMLHSFFKGIGFTILFLLLGTLLDYVVTQILSQFIIANCSEDCYFGYFNAIFIFIVLVSLLGGIWIGVRAYHRKSDKA